MESKLATVWKRSVVRFFLSCLKQAFRRCYSDITPCRGHNAVNYKDSQKSQSSYHACESPACSAPGRVTRQLTLEWMNELILHCDSATEGCVSNDFFRHSLDDSPAFYFDIVAQPILEYRWIDSYSQQSLQTQFKVATVYSIHTQSLSWCSIGLVPNVLPRRDEGSGKPCAVDRAS